MTWQLRSAESYIQTCLSLNENQTNKQTVLAMTTEPNTRTPTYRIFSPSTARALNRAYGGKGLQEPQSYFHEYYL